MGRAAEAGKAPQRSNRKAPLLEAERRHDSSRRCWPAHRHSSDPFVLEGGLKRRSHRLLHFLCRLIVSPGCQKHRKAHGGPWRKGRGGSRWRRGRRRGWARRRGRGQRRGWRRDDRLAGDRSPGQRRQSGGRKRGSEALHASGVGLRGGELGSYRGARRGVGGEESHCRHHASRHRRQGDGRDGYGRWVNAEQVGKPSEQRLLLGGAQARRG